MSGNLVESKIRIAHGVRIENQGGQTSGPVRPKRDTSETSAAGGSEAWDGNNGERKEGAQRCNGNQAPQKEKKERKEMHTARKRAFGMNGRVATSRWLRLDMAPGMVEVCKPP